MRGRLTAIVALCLTLACAACGSSGSTRLTVASSDKSALLAAADRAAKFDGGHAKRVEAVQTTRGRAADLTGHGSTNQNEPVWVVQVSGDQYTCGACSVPDGAVAPTGHYITLVVKASDLTSTDSGLAESATDLAGLGDVQVLRQE